MWKKHVLVKDLYRIQEGVEILQGSFSYEFLNCNTNSKTIKEGETFFAIGKGNNYIKDALEKGATGCVVEKDVCCRILEKYPEVTIVRVESALKTLQNLAAYKRALYHIPVIAVTGSVGKTSTKDIIAKVLSQKYNVLKTEGNFNNHIGLPITIMKLEKHDVMVLEMGMNHFHEIETLAKIARPNIAVITNIGTSHIGILGSRRNIMKAKLEILKGLQETGTLIINNDCDLLKFWNENENDSKLFDVLTYSMKENSDIKAENIDMKENETKFNVCYREEDIKITLPIFGEPFIYNSLAAIGVASVLRMEPEYVQEALKNFELTKKRMEIKNIDGVKYINDAYNASYESVKYALEYLSNMEAKRKIAVLGDMFELGDFSEELHKKVGMDVESSNIDVLITAGEFSKFISDEVKNVKEKIHLNNKDEVVEKIKEIKQDGDVFLLKASNGMKFYEIVDDLTGNV